MIFKPHLLDKILAGQKTQTRRPAYEGETAINPFGAPIMLTADNEISHYFVIREVVSASGKTRFKVGKSVAAQPGRGKAAPMVASLRTADGVIRKIVTDESGDLLWAIASPARILITELRYEDVRNITHIDSVAEGFSDQWEFWQTWGSFYIPKAIDYIINKQRIVDISKAPRAEIIEFAYEFLLSCADEPFRAWAITFRPER